MGFSEVYDLIGGRAAWTVLGFPTEGQVGDRRRISQYVLEAQTVRVTDTMAAVHRLGATDRTVAVVGEGDVLLGAIQPSAFPLSAETPVEGVMITAPGTIRPDLRVEEALQQVKDDGLDHVFVTTASGVLVGLVIPGEIHV